MRTASGLERMVALMSFAAMFHAGGGTAALAAVSPASLQGRIVTRAGGGVAGAVLKMADPATGTIHTAGATDERGRYELAGLPPGRYEIAVSKEDTLYLSSRPLDLVPGEMRSLNLAVGGEVSAADPAPETAEGPAEKERKKMGFWGNPLTVTVLFLGTAAIIGEVVDDDDDEEDESSSPSEQ